MFPITQDVLDVSRYLEDNYEPAAILQRDKGKWLVRDLPFDFHAPPGVKVRRDEWGICTSGDYVRVPLFPYCARCDDPCVAIGYAFELGFKASEYIREFMPGHKIARLHISLGHPVEEYKVDGHPSLRFWIGCGVILEEA